MTDTSVRLLVGAVLLAVLAAVFGPDANPVFTLLLVVAGIFLLAGLVGAVNARK